MDVTSDKTLKNLYTYEYSLLLKRGTSHGLWLRARVTREAIRFVHIMDNGEKFQHNN